MKHALRIILVLVAVAAWGINGSTLQAEGVAFPVDRHTAGAVGTEDAKVPQSGIPGKAGKGQILPAEDLKGRSPKDFLMPDGRFDLKAIRASGYQGPLDLEGFNVRTDPRTGEPVLAPSAITKRVEGKGTLDQQVGFDVGIEPRNGEPALSPIANARIYSHPDDTFWTDRFSCLQGLNGYCYALCVYDGKLIAGGSFSVANCTLAANIASWDGSSWSPLGLGMGGYDPYVYALAVYDNKLIAGGNFTTAGGVSANYIASWDGSSWSPLGSGMGGTTYPYVYALTVYDNKLIAGGYFTTAGGVSAKCIASWDGSSWSPLGSGMWAMPPVPPGVYALRVYDNKLIAGGYFTTAGGVSAKCIASWDDSSWSPLGSGMNSSVSALTVYDNKLIAGGGFTTAGDKVSAYIAQWTKRSWIRGDANGDGVINSGDIVYLINYLFAGGPASEPWQAGDANCDGKVNSADIVYLINYLFAGGPAPGCP